MPSTAPGAHRTANPSTGIPPGVDLIAQAFASDVGVDNEALQLGNNGFVWFDVLGITPSRDRTLDEVKDKVEARWRDDQITSRLMAKATDMVQKLGQGGKLADEAAGLGTKVESASPFKRDATVAGLPAAVIAAAFRTAKDGAGQAPGARHRRMGRFPRHRREGAAARSRLR